MNMPNFNNLKFWNREDSDEKSGLLATSSDSDSCEKLDLLAKDILLSASKMEYNPEGYNSIEGLSEKEVQEKRVRWGYNEFCVEPDHFLWKLLDVVSLVN